MIGTPFCALPNKATIEDELAGRKPQSQIQRIIEQLGIRFIPALSPQAKGRIERLWQTFQDRLRKEMRLTGIDSLEQANLFLENSYSRLQPTLCQTAAGSAKCLAPASLKVPFYKSCPLSSVVEFSFQEGSGRV
jgi:hypothetical protein